MCSLNDGDENCRNIVRDDKFLFKGKPEKCRSCDSKAFVLLRKKDAYCKECFLKIETHKFRAALGKTKMMKPQDTVLFAYSGSQSSSALLHLLHSGVSEKHHKKLLFQIKVLFIDEGAVFKFSDEERMNLCKKIQQNVEHYGFPLLFISLSECISKVASPTSFLKIYHDKDRELLKLFDNVKTVTLKENLLYILRQRLIQKVALQLKCNKIFMAEVGDALAVKLLSNFSLGRGDQASFETGFCNTSNPECIVIRPLRDFLKKEIVFYNRFHNIDSVAVPAFLHKNNMNMSIQKLTEKFIADLQMNFPSTAYTIFRTGEKLGDNTRDFPTKTCCFCGNKFTTSNCSDYNAILAIKFSKKISKREIEKCHGRNSCCGSNSSKLKNFEKNICFGCMEIVNDLDDINYIPSDLITSTIENINFNEMKNQISEFLIEDS